MLSKLPLPLKIKHFTHFALSALIYGEENCALITQNMHTDSTKYAYFTINYENMHGL